MGFTSVAQGLTCRHGQRRRAQECEQDSSDSSHQMPFRALGRVKGPDTVRDAPCRRNDRSITLYLLPRGAALWRPHDECGAAAWWPLKRLSPLFVYMAEMF